VRERVRERESERVSERERERESKTTLLWVALPYISRLF
jgi:hypothetical protein